MTEHERTLLLVDDEENILRALKRLFRRDGYQILMANSGEQGLEILKENDVGVILSDQRMPHMNGTEFLKLAKEICPASVRIVLSGYADLESVTGAINEGSIYKFLTKPWDDELIRANISEAFEYHELKIKNELLTEQLKSTNVQLTKSNEELQALADEREKLVMLRSQMLQSIHDIIENVPMAILAIDADGGITMYNQELMNNLQLDIPGAIGMSIEEALPPELCSVIKKLSQQNGVEMLTIHGESYFCHVNSITHRGNIIVLMPQ